LQLLGDYTDSGDEDSDDMFAASATPPAATASDDGSGHAKSSSGSTFEPEDSEDKDSEGEEEVDGAMDVDEEDQPRKPRSHQPRRGDVAAARAHTEALSGGTRTAAGRKRKGPPVMAESPEFDSYLANPFPSVSFLPVPVYPPSVLNVPTYNSLITCLAVSRHRHTTRMMPYNAPSAPRGASHCPHLCYWAHPLLVRTSVPIYLFPFLRVAICIANICSGVTPIAARFAPFEIIVKRTIPVTAQAALAVLNPPAPERPARARMAMPIAPNPAIHAAVVTELVGCVRRSGAACTSPARPN
ncbi:hypothetical protein BD309DRAFT_816839, partial [Dichomitus squalens]